MTNLIVIKTDQQRFDTLGCCGHRLLRTPHLDALAGRGWMMENAFCTSPLCVPSRVSFFTGQYPHRTGSVSNAPRDRIQREQWSFARALKEHGYRVGLAGKNHTFADDHLRAWFDYREEYNSHGKTHGTITAADRRISDYRLREPRPGWNSPLLLGGLIEEPEPFPEDQCITARIADDAVRFLEAGDRQPFFLHLSFPDPHWPQLVCEPYYSMYDPRDVELEALDLDWHSHPFAHYVQAQALGFDRYTVAQRQRILATYYGQITFIDRAIGRVLDRLEQLGQRERTSIVFTSDHGDFGGRYGLIEKTKGFYECLVRVPLLVCAPGLAGGRRSPAQISNIDVMPTVFELLGLPVPESVQGLPFAGVLRGDTTAHRDTIYAECGDPRRAPPPPRPAADFGRYARDRHAREGAFWFTDYTGNGRAAMIRRAGWKYCHYTGDVPELYDLQNDPLEKNNLAALPSYRMQRDELSAALLDWSLAAPFPQN